ncbi:MAG: hypothetical protein SFT92_02355 [Rickettsiales bacterium]|nr:hypothetical protein [Rickettsiales bacterium]
MEKWMRLLKENPALAAGIGLPLLLMVFFAIASTLPGMLVEPPKYGLLFTQNKYEAASDQDIRVTVENKKVKVLTRFWDDKNYNRQRPRLYYFDPKTNNTREITIPVDLNNKDIQWKPVELPEIQNWVVDVSTTAPDGYSFSKDGSVDSGSFLFSARSDRSVTIYKDGNMVKIPTLSNRRYDYYNVEFLGWVTQP